MPESTAAWLVTTGDFATAVTTAIAAHAAVVSISYGYTPDVTNTHGFDVSAFHHKGPCSPTTASPAHSATPR